MRRRQWCIDRLSPRYLVRFGGDSPFGHSTCLDMKSVYATKARLPYSRVGKRSMPAELVSHRPHTHNALDDAVEQAELLANLFRLAGTGDVRAPASLVNASLSSSRR